MGVGEMQEMKEKQGAPAAGAGTVGPIRWVYLAVSALGLLFVGFLYGWSIIKAPLSEELHWSASQLALNYTLSICCFCLGTLLEGWLDKRTPLPVLLLTAAGLTFAGYFMVSRLSGANVYLLYLSYGIIVGSGIGIAYNALLSAGNAWFPDKKGTSSGILMMCFGLSTMVLGKITSALFASDAFGWRKTFLLLGVSMAVVLVIAAAVLRRPTAGTVLPQSKKQGRQAEEDFEQRDYTVREVVRRPTYWIFYLYGALSAFVGSVVIGIAQDLALSLGAEMALATTMVGALSVSNGLGRIVCGVAFDRLGRNKTMWAFNVITLLAPILMLVALRTGSLAAAAVSFCLTGISFGCNPTISSAFISTFYGMKDFPINYGIANTKLLFSSTVATVANALFVSTGSYTASFLMLTAFAALAAILNLFIRRP